MPPTADQERRVQESEEAVQRIEAQNEQERLRLEWLLAQVRAQQRLGARDGD